jgi:hypothetical protein
MAEHANVLFIRVGRTHEQKGSIGILSAGKNMGRYLAEIAENAKGKTGKYNDFLGGLCVLCERKRKKAFRRG